MNRAIYDLLLIDKLIWIFSLVLMMTFVPFSASYSQTPTSVADDLSINIQQTKTNPKWKAEHSFRYIGDTVIEVNGKISGADSSHQKVVYGWQLGGPEPSDFHYSAHLIHGGKGYVVAKNLDEDEANGISEVHFVIYDFNQAEGMYKRTELSFENQEDPKWYVMGEFEGGSDGGLYISKDRSLLLIAPIGDDAKTEAHTPDDSNLYQIYSLKTLQMVTQGYLGPVKLVKTDNEDDYDLVLQGVTYELFSGVQIFDK